MGCNGVIKEESVSPSIHHHMHRFTAFPFSALVEMWLDAFVRLPQFSFQRGESISRLIRMFGTLTSIVVALHRWVPANQPSVEHWSISTSCRLMSTRTTPLQDRQEDTINPSGEELRLSVQSEGCCASTCGVVSCGHVEKWHVFSRTRGVLGGN